MRWMLVVLAECGGSMTLPQELPDAQPAVDAEIVVDARADTTADALADTQEASITCPHTADVCSSNGLVMCQKTDSGNPGAFFCTTADGANGSTWESVSRPPDAECLAWCEISK